jgi:hypothetical protein
MAIDATLLKPLMDELNRRLTGWGGTPVQQAHTLLMMSCVLVGGLSLRQRRQFAVHLQNMAIILKKEQPDNDNGSDQEAP